MINLSDLSFLITIFFDR